MLISPLRLAEECRSLIFRYFRLLMLIFIFAMLRDAAMLRPFTRRRFFAAAFLRYARFSSISPPFDFRRAHFDCRAAATPDC